MQPWLLSSIMVVILIMEIKKLVGRSKMSAPKYAKSWQRCLNEVKVKIDWINYYLTWMLDYENQNWYYASISCLHPSPADLPVEI